MPKFFCLYNSFSDSLDINERLLQLENACLNNNVEFEKIDEGNVNYLELPTLQKNDALYNCSRGSMLLERVLITQDIKTFYRSFPFTGITEASNYWSILHEKFDIATPITIWIGTNDRKLLKEYVNYLHGFPVIVKTYGGTGGVGVIKVDNYAVLYSLADYLVSCKTDFSLKQFIPSSSCERLIVLDGKVLSGTSRPNKSSDFRSDSCDTKVISKEYSKEINELAINAVSKVNLFLAGVDIIIDERNGEPFVLEINFPFNFSHSLKITGVDIADRMIKWLFK